MEPSKTLAAQAVLPKLPPLDYRIPHWKAKDLVERSCPFCGAQKTPLLRRPDDLPVAYCDECAAWYVTQIPTQDAIHGFYQEYYTESRPAQLDARTARMMKREASNASEDCRQKRFAVTIGVGDRRIVDVGCGLGGFLLSLREQGVEAIGVEVCKEARDFATKQLGLVVYEDLSVCLSEVGPVDGIVFNDVIEHPRDPLKLFSNAASGLRRGGVLSMVTPNGGCAGAGVETARDWVGFRVDLEHLQYLSTKTVQVLAHKVGFRVEHLETTGFPGLPGIDHKPNRPSRGSMLVRETRGMMARTALGKMVRTIRSCVRDERARRTYGPGNYHLFALLRRE